MLPFRYFGEPTSNLSAGWVNAVLRWDSLNYCDLSPLVVSFEGFSGVLPDEDLAIRGILDSALQDQGQKPIETTANTIFPASMWDPKQPRKLLFRRYFNIYPKVKKVNHFGTYFHRLINYPEDADEDNAENQLDFIIDHWSKPRGHRRSALQAVLYDPRKDMVDTPQRGFPCLQSLTFVPARNSLSLNAFYPTQCLFERAFGNYLGLCRLGAFVAHELGLKFSRLTCFVGTTVRGDMRKSALRALVTQIQERNSRSSVP